LETVLLSSLHQSHVAAVRRGAAGRRAGLQTQWANLARFPPGHHAGEIHVSVARCKWFADLGRMTYEAVYVHDPAVAALALVLWTMAGAVAQPVSSLPVASTPSPGRKSSTSFRMASVSRSPLETSGQVEPGRFLHRRPLGTSRRTPGVHDVVGDRCGSFRAGLWPLLERCRQRASTWHTRRQAHPAQFGEVTPTAR